MFIHLRAVQEEYPDQKWLDLWETRWPFYRNWYLRDGYSARPGYLTCLEKLQTYMPELLPFHERLAALAGGGDLEARYLSLWKPPAYMSGCSQVVWDRRNDLALIRNYDYSPELFEGVFMQTNWLQPVMGIVDCSWGLLDGVNASGLSLSLTFGGRNVVGEGFGIPLVQRYVLETCTTTQEAIEKLCSIPIHMAYNVTVMDEKGFFATVYLSPDRPPVVTENRVGTNHQITVEWEDYARMSGTTERHMFLLESIGENGLTEEEMVARFLKEPLYNTKYDQHFGTIYTAVYHPRERTVELIWPGKSYSFGFDDFHEMKIVVNVNKTVNKLLVE